MANPKLLLLEDVEGLGRKGEVVSVRPGYARNFLLPEGHAIVASPHALRMQTRLQEERQKRAVIDKQESDALSTKIQDQTVTAIVKIDHEGHMYGSVSSLDIVHLLQQQMGVELEKRSVQLQHAIKEVGVHTINLKLKEGVTASFTLKVVPEEGVELPANKKPE